MADRVAELEAAVQQSKQTVAEETALLAIGPLDGRYASRLTDLQQYFSEYALIKYRVKVEVEYFIELCGAVPQLASVPESKFEPLRDLYRNFSLADAQQIKATERITNHDVKAVEYFLKEKFDLLDLAVHKEFIHFGLTSQDVNNTAVPLMLKDAVANVYLPKLRKLVATLQQRAVDWDHLPMLARTHGQPATPTRMGKEMMVFVERVENQLDLLELIPIGCKMGGASGTIAAHTVAYPETDWEAFFNKLCARLGMQRQQYLLRPLYMEYLYVEFVCKCIYVYFTYILDGAGTPLRSSITTTSARCATTWPGSTRSSSTTAVTCGCTYSSQSLVFSSRHSSYSHSINRSTLDGAQVRLAGLLHAERQEERGRLLGHAAQGQPHRLRERRRKLWPRKRRLWSPLCEAADLTHAARSV